MKGKAVKVAVILAILVAVMSAAALPGAAQIYVPPGTTVTSATLYLYTLNSEDAEQQVRVHRVMGSWDEMAVTWNSQTGFDPTVEGSFIPHASTFSSVDLTDLVRAWMDGTHANYGVLLEQDLDPADLPDASFYPSSEFGVVAVRPALVICLSYGPCVTIQRDVLGMVADAYIWSQEPDTNFGSSDRLYTSLVDGDRPVKKRSLVWFELPVVPPGCTLTPGYWKTHSTYGPAPYDATWALIGEDTIFFNSGQSYYEVLWTEPKGGNAYYILAHAYIAAELNFLNGADPTMAQAAFDAATALFSDPAYTDSIPKNDPNRAVAIGLAETLDAYNNGLLGPPHCIE
jgi:hypothetical protein